LRRLLIVLFALLAVHTVYKIVYPTAEWRQKTTVTVSVDGETRGASSVVGLRAVEQPDVLPEMHLRHFDLRGEAVMLEVRPGRYLFALIRDASAMARHYYMGGLFAEQLKPWRTGLKRRLSTALSHLRASQTLDPP
jgi:hypothetical protein